MSRAFVVMNFAMEFEDVYEFGIKGACAEAGWECIRLDKEHHDGLVIGKIRESIRAADLVIAELSSPSANVYYEVGYAHASHKRVIHALRDGHAIPFDLNQEPHIIYQLVKDLKLALVEKLQWAETAKVPPPDYPPANFDAPSKLRTANSYWLGHDLMWTMAKAQDPQTPAEELWYGVEMCLDHARQLGLDNVMADTPLQTRAEQLDPAAEDAVPIEELRANLAKVLGTAVRGYGADLTQYQGTYRGPSDARLHEMWKKLKQSGLGDELGKQADGP